MYPFRCHSCMMWCRSGMPCQLLCLRWCRGLLLSRSCMSKVKLSQWKCWPLSPGCWSRETGQEQGVGASLCWLNNWVRASSELQLLCCVVQFKSVPRPVGSWQEWRLCAALMFCWEIWSLPLWHVPHTWALLQTVTPQIPMRVQGQDICRSLGGVTYI